jgi:hypothetical protein
MASWMEKICEGCTPGGEIPQEPFRRANDTANASTFSRYERLKPKQFPALSTAQSVDQPHNPGSSAVGEMGMLKQLTGKQQKKS